MPWITFQMLMAVCALLLNTAYASAEMCLSSKRILILHSYSTDYSWTRDMHDEIVRVLENQACEISYRVEYMDTKNHFNDEYYDQLFGLYKAKFGALKFDGIVATDNNAIEFLNQYGEALFGNTRMVACGVNNYSPQQDGGNFWAVVPEQGAHLETLRQAKRQRPHATTVHVVRDETLTGQAIMQEVRAAMQGVDLGLQPRYVEGKSLAELQEYVSTLGPEDIVYLIPYFKDATGTVYSEKIADALLAERSSVPIYVSWSFQIGAGPVGGRVVSGRLQGAQAAMLLLAAMDEASIGVMRQELQSPYSDVYDYSAMVRHGIPLHSLPAGAQVLHLPSSFYSRHRQVILPAAGIALVLCILLALTMLNLKKQLVINLKNAQLLEANKEVMDTQRELVTTLGEVIEFRSHEAAKHVRRVAAISRLLGEKLHLSSAQLDILEAASPMHDVGKIGIPESLLGKPGRLTEDEFELMKRHTVIGMGILRGSNRPLLHAASTIAHQHHERWDGTGYPCGLREGQIDLLARITMLADVYDALSSSRCYKEAWSEEEVLQFIRQERGSMFDPALVDVLLENMDDVRAIRSRYAPEAKETPPTASPLDRLKDISLVQFCGCRGADTQGDQEG